mgnify:CR=1 FL=1
MLARTLEGRIVLMRRTGLRDVRNLVPHDRVDHLEPLSRDGLQRFAVRHAAVAAPRVVLAPPPVGSGEAVAREDKQVLQALVSLPGRRHRRHRSPGLAVARRQPAVRRQSVMVREVVDVYGDRQLGRRFRPYPGDGEQASVGLVASKQGRRDRKWRNGASLQLIDPSLSPGLRLRSYLKVRFRVQHGVSVRKPRPHCRIF